MGCYINPKDEPKEQWVREHALPIRESDLRGWNYAPDNSTVPIVVIDNGAFRAAGVLYCAKERERFLRSLDYESKTGRVRPMWFGFVNIEDVRTVSDYDDWVVLDTPS